MGIAVVILLVPLATKLDTLWMIGGVAVISL
jgi:hypothetical protein